MTDDVSSRNEYGHATVKQSRLIRALPLSPEHPGGVIPLEDVGCAAVREGVAYWHRLRGDRNFPSRLQVSPRDITGILRHALLLRVIDAASDYEYRIVGDAHVVAHGFSMQGKCLSQMDEHAPGYGAVLKTIYDPVVRNRTPYALRGWLSRGDDDPEYIHAESVFLPLGANDETVDHILNFSSYTLPHGAMA